MTHRVAKFIQRLSGTTPCPEIRWQDVVRIEAMGTDAFSAFQIWLTFTHSDGTKAEVAIETKGYWDIVDSLHTRFLSIPATWYDEMSEQQWHVERVLYSRHEEVALPCAGRQYG
jgi:hypothetical protein